ncbi:MAG: PGPGW domain-containing protein [Nitrospirae bacterium]|nr:PGPGW domain-containing protein [Nitrospirota bacterium]
MDAQSRRAGKKAANRGGRLHRAAYRCCNAWIARSRYYRGVVPLGLGILSTEFVWAAMLLKTIKGKFQKTKEGGNSHETK